MENSDFTKILVKDEQLPLSVLKKIVISASPSNDHCRIKITKRKNREFSDVIQKKARKEDCSDKTDEIKKEGGDIELQSDYVEHDKKYFFVDSTKIDCKLCDFKGELIVEHYRTKHPNSEVLISRINPNIADILIKDAILNREEYDKDHPVLEKMTCNFKCPFCLMFIKVTPNTYCIHISGHTGEFSFHCNLCSYRTYNHTNILSHLNQIHHKTHKTEYKMVYPGPNLSKYVFGYICSKCNFIQLIRTTVEEHVMMYHPGMAEIHKVNLGMFFQDKDRDAVDENRTNGIYSNENHSNENQPNLSYCIDAITSETSEILTDVKESSDFELEEIKIKTEPNVLEDDLHPIEFTTFTCQTDMDIKQDSEGDETETFQWNASNEKEDMTSICDPLQTKLVTEPIEEDEKIQTDLSSLIPLITKENDKPLSSEVKFQGRTYKGPKYNCNFSEMVPPYNCEDDGFPSCLFKTLYFDEYLKHVEAIHQVSGLSSFLSEHEQLRGTIMEGWLVKEVGPFQCRYCKKATVTHQEMGRHLAVSHAQDRCLFFYRKFIPSDTVTIPEQVNLEDPSFINHVIQLPDQAHLCDFKLTDSLLSSTSAKPTDGAPNNEGGLLNESDPLYLEEKPPKDGEQLTGDSLQKPPGKKCTLRLHCKWEDCKKTYDSQTTLVKHIKKVHIQSQSGKEFTCLWNNCPKKSKPFFWRCELLSHMRVHSGEKPYKCTFRDCNMAFSRVQYFNRHQRRHKGERPFLCEFPNCFKSFSKVSDKTTHQKMHENTKSCQVTSLSKNYTERSSVRKYVKRHIVDDQLKVEEKSVKSEEKEGDLMLKKSPDSLNGDRHQRTDYDDCTVRLQCKWKSCCQTRDSQTALVKHIEKDHVQFQTGEEFTCFWINCFRNSKPFTNKQSLLVHMRLHSGEKPYKCPSCNKAFSQISHLQIHERTHTGEKPYVCQFVNCFLSFSTSSNRDVHQRTHYNLKPYACQFVGCLKKYASWSSFQKHVQLKNHKQVKHKWVQNTQKTDDGSDDEEHQRTNDDTFQCKWKDCYQIYVSQMAFVQHIEENHIKVQRGAELICCWNNCSRKSKPFTTRRYLSVHMRVHSGEKPYKCPVQGCNKAFSQTGNLISHQRRSHPEVRPYLSKTDDTIDEQLDIKQKSTEDNQEEDDLIVYNI